MRTLSLTQKYFLCSIGDKGHFTSLNPERATCLIASGILELLMADLILLEKKKLSVTAPLPDDKIYLKSVYEFIEKKQPVKLETIVENYSFKFTDKNLNELVEAIGDSLVQSGSAIKEVGGLFGRKVFYHPDVTKREQIVRSLHTALLEERALSEDYVALTALLDKSNILTTYFSAFEKKDLKKRLKEIKSDESNQLVTKMVDYLEMIFALTITSIC